MRLHSRAIIRRLVVAALLFVSTMILIASPVYAAGPVVAGCVVGGAGHANAVTTATTTTITPHAVGDLMVIVADGDHNGHNFTLSVSESTGGDTITLGVHINKIVTSGLRSASYLWYIKNTANAAGRTFTVTANMTSFTTLWISACDIETSSFIIQNTGRGSATTGSSASTNSIAFAANSIVFGTAYSDGGIGMTAGFTNVGPAGCNSTGTGDYYCGQYQDNTSSGSTTLASTTAGNGYTIVGASFQTNPNSFVNLKICLQESGAPSGTFALTGGAVSPTTAVGTFGCTTTALTTSFSSVITVTVPTDGANTRYRMNSTSTSATTEQFTSPGSGLTSTVQVDSYYQVSNTYQMAANGPAGFTTWDATFLVNLNGFFTGAQTTLTTFTLPQGQTNSAPGPAIWSDYGKNASTPFKFDNWQTTGTHSQLPTTGGNTFTFPYNHTSVTVTTTVTTTSLVASTSSDYLWLLAVPIGLIVMVPVVRRKKF